MTLREKVVYKATQKLLEAGLHVRHVDCGALGAEIADAIMQAVEEDRGSSIGDLLSTNIEWQARAEKAESREAALLERLEALAEKWDDYDRKRYTGCHSGYAYELREALAVKKRSTP